MLKKPANGSLHKVRSAITFLFSHPTLNCRCFDGRCPNYREDECGAGGRAVFKQFSVKEKSRAMRELLNKDSNFSPTRVMRNF